MTDCVALRNWISESGLKISAIASKMNLTSAGLSKKIEGKSEFKASEILVFSRDFHMSPEMRDAIFFSQ